VRRDAVTEDAPQQSVYGRAAGGLARAVDNVSKTIHAVRLRDVNSIASMENLCVFVGLVCGAGERKWGERRHR
jgi:hypothetical protein